MDDGQSILICRKALPRGHPATAATLTSLGALLVDRGRARDAEPLLREALEIRTAKLGKSDDRTAATASALGASLAMLSRDTEGEPLLVDRHAALDRGDADSAMRADAIRHLADYYEARGKRTEATRLRAQRSLSPQRR